ncbi:MAG TPA: hypothetical protein EYG85_01785 [Crocinitomix sp.]|nr:hypothetical protein [Crocinitomix sp.]
MKILVLVLMLSFFAGCESSRESNVVITEPDTCDCKTLILDKDYNRFYLNDRKKPFTGTCNIIENGILKSTRNFKEGKYHGDFIEYYDNGQVKLLIEYKAHFMNGDVKSFSEEGKLIGHSVYKQSRLIEIKL